MDKIVSNKNNIDNLKASKENFAQLLEESFSKENKTVKPGAATCVISTGSAPATCTN